MKFVINFLSIVALSISIISCGSTKIFWSQFAKEAKSESSPCFIEYKDGRIEKYNSIPSVFSSNFYSLSSTPNVYLKADGKDITLSKKEIKGFQENGGYISIVKRSDEEFAFVYNSGFGKLEKDSLGCAVRVCKGKIELFRRGMQYESLGQRISSDFLYARKGRDKEIIPVNKSVLREMVADNTQIFTNFEELYKQGRAEQVFKLITEYNKN